MADDMSGKIMDMLSNPEMMKRLNDVIGTLGATQSSNDSDSSDAIAANAKSIINSINHTDDHRIALLNALKPYLRDSRAAGVDKAIKMLRLTKLTEIFRNEGL